MSFKLIKLPTTITLRNPDFEDTVRIGMNDIRRRTRNGDIKTFVSADWYPRTLRIYKFSRITGTLIGQLKTFFATTVGLEITITDHYGDSYDGVIWSPVPEIIATRPNCSYDLSFEFLENMV